MAKTQTPFKVFGDGELIDVAPDLVVRSSVVVQYRNEDQLPYDLDIALDYSKEIGRYVVQRLDAIQKHDSIEVNGVGLRSIPIKRLVRAGLSQITGVRDWNSQPGVWDIMRLREIGAISEAASKGPSDPETLLWVARIYRIAEISNDNPAKAVQTDMGLTAPTASVWIRRARDTGVLRNRDDSA